MTPMRLTLRVFSVPTGAPVAKEHPKYEVRIGGTGSSRESGIPAEIGPTQNSQRRLPDSRQRWEATAGTTSARGFGS